MDPHNGEDTVAHLSSLATPAGMVALVSRVAALEIPKAASTVWFVSHEAITNPCSISQGDRDHPDASKQVVLPSTNIQQHLQQPTRALRALPAFRRAPLSK
jgi:hypothetical protein